MDFAVRVATLTFLLMEGMVSDSELEALEACQQKAIRSIYDGTLPDSF